MDINKKKSSLLSVVLLLALVLAGTWFRVHDGAKDGMEKTANGIAEKIRASREVADTVVAAGSPEDSLKTGPDL